MQTSITDTFGPVMMPIMAMMALLIGALCANVVHSADSKIDFNRDIKPILETHCTKCHGPTKRKGGLRLSNKRDAFLPGNDGTVAIKPGDSKNSEMILRCRCDTRYTGPYIIAGYRNIYSPVRI